MKPRGTRLLKTSRFVVESVSHTTRDGVIHQREIVRHPGSVTILPLVDEDHVCLIRNYRVSVERRLIELPAGTLESGEDPRECAARELIEETGYHAAELTDWTTFFLAPGILDEQTHLFIASGLSLGEAAREPWEDIENLVVAWTDILQLIRTGEIQDAKTTAFLLMYDRFKRTEGNMPG